MIRGEQEFLQRMRSNGFIHCKAPNIHMENMMGQGATRTLYFSAAAILRSSHGAASRSLGAQKMEPGTW